MKSPRAINSLSLPFHPPKESSSCRSNRLENDAYALVESRDTVRESGGKSIPVILRADRFARISLNIHRAASGLVRGNNLEHSPEMYDVQSSRLMSIGRARGPLRSNNLGYSQSGDAGSARPRTTGRNQDGGSAMRKAVRRNVHNLIRNVVYEAVREPRGGSYSRDLTATTHQPSLLSSPLLFSAFPPTTFFFLAFRGSSVRSTVHGERRFTAQAGRLNVVLIK